MKTKGIEVVINEESYTSKCDSLSLEEVKCHIKYKGKRMGRGLFSSAKRKIINADLNGAINIMRKYLLKEGIKMKKIEGKGIYNPKKINIHRKSKATTV